MKKSIVFPLAAIVLLASCEREIAAPEVVVNPDSESFSLCVGIPETKTSFGELDGNKRKVYWSDGDQIAVSGSASQALSGVAAKSTEAVFVFDKALSAPYDVLYPAGIWKDASTVTLPATQTYVVDGIADGSLPMAGYSADGIAATLRYLCAIVNVPVKQSNGNADKVTAVTIASIGNEYMSGDFTIDYQEATLKGQSGTASVSILPDVTLSSTPTNFYVVVPAATYATGIKVIVASENSGEMSKALSRSVALEAGHIYNLDAIEFSPEAGAEEVKVDISSAEDLIQLATAYNSGTYSDKALVVNMTSDVAFDATSSAAFSATGGIGSTDDGKGNSNYFHGTFNGNNNTISGLKGSVPVFAFIGTSGVVKDLIIDSNCSFVFTPDNNMEYPYLGAVAGYHKGSIENVTVKAAVSMAEVTGIEKICGLGGIAGRSTIGKISGCTYSGAIDVPAGFASSNKLLVGGIVAYTSNDTGVVSGCTLDGTISVAGKITSTDKANPYLAVGGIVGYNCAAVSNCSTNDHPTVTTAHDSNSSVGTIVVKSDTSYYTAVGGIVGENNKNEVSNCTNGAGIFITIFKASGDASARYIRSGGIVGKNDAEGVVSDCINNAKVQHRSNPRLQSLGGIVGHNAGTVMGCTNTADVNHMTTGISGATNKGGRIVNIAGIIGDNLEGAVVSDVQNSGNVQISAMESNYDATNDKPVCEVRMGGVIAYNLAAIDGGGSKNITNSGQVYFSPNFDKQFIGYELGGIVGYSQASVQNVKNSGYVYFRWDSDANVASKVYLGGIVGMMAGDGTISGCVNEGGDKNAGEVNLAVKAGAAKHTDNYAGGILGYTINNVSISGCTNSGYIHGGNSTKQNGTSCYVGGIVGALSGASSIASCTNSGNVYNNHSSNSSGTNNTAYNGGIAGWVSGTAEALISISDCENNSTETSSRRGYNGGIVGYANYAALQNDIAKGTNFSGSSYFIGGVVGWAVNSTVTKCNATGTSITSTQVQKAGGIVARLGAGSILDGCSSSINSITGPDDNPADGVSYLYGGVSGDSVEGSTIKNCHYPASGTISSVKQSFPWQICGDANFTDGGGNAADL